MSFWSRLFGRRRSQLPGWKELRKLVTKYFDAPGNTDQQRLIERHTELLGAQADLVFKDVMLAEPNPILRKMLWDQYYIVVRCREIGIAAAFSERMNMLQRVLQKMPKELRDQYLAAILRGDNVTALALAAEYPEIHRALQSAEDSIPPMDLS